VMHCCCWFVVVVVCSVFRHVVVRLLVLIPLCVYICVIVIRCWFVSLRLLLLVLSLYVDYFTLRLLFTLFCCCSLFGSLIVTLSFVHVRYCSYSFAFVIGLLMEHSLPLLISDGDANWLLLLFTLRFAFVRWWCCYCWYVTLLLLFIVIAVLLLFTLLLPICCCRSLFDLFIVVYRWLLIVVVVMLLFLFILFDTYSVLLFVVVPLFALRCLLLLLDVIVVIV
jgi:hypothetical protein